MSMNSAVDRNIFIADKDLAFRNALAHGFESEGYRVTSFSDGNALLAAARQKSPSCIVLDADISNPPGLDVLGELGHRIVAPIIVTAGRADVETAVSAMKKGARDFMMKPCEADSVVSRARAALSAKRSENGDGTTSFAVPGGDRLTPREREVLERIALGASNKEAGRQLGISPRTVEVHRAQIMEKLGARNTADLVRIVYSPA